MDDLLTTERLLILLLALCMGARVIRARWNNHEVSVSTEDDEPESE